jgi:hypothetical protein
MTPINAILAYSPWALWPCMDTSGSPLDVSGNNRHGHVSSGSPGYLAGNLTSRVTQSIQLDNSRLGFPIPLAHLSGTAGTWTIGGMFQFDAELGTGSPAQSVHGSPFLSQAAGPYLTQSDFLAQYARIYGENINVRNMGNVAGAMNVMKLNAPMFIFFMGTTNPGAFWRFETWINGVKMLSGPSMIASTGPTASFFHVGRCVDAAAPFAKFRVGLLCCWNGELSPRQIIDITEFAMDASGYSLAYNP